MKYTNAGLLVGALLISGCARINLTAMSLDKTVMMTGQPGRPYTVIRHFSDSTKAMYLVFDLATIREPEVEKLIQRQLKATGGDAVINVEIEHQFSFVDSLVRVIAEPVFGMSSVKVEGDVIKYNPS